MATTTYTTTQQQPVPGQTPTATAPQPAPTQKDPFAASGGGVWTGSAWLPKSHPGAQQYLSQQPQQPAQPGAPATPAQLTPEQQQKNAFNSALLSMMQQNPSSVSINDPALKTQMDVFRQETDRARRQRQMAAAEMLGAEGAEQSGAMAAEVAGSYEDAGRANAAFGAELVGKEVVARRDELMKALSLYGNMLDADKQRALQLEIAKLDAQIKREGIGSQNSLGQSDLRLREKLGMGQLNLGLLNAMLGNDQFGKNLGFQIGKTEAEMNRDALLSLMRR